MREELTQTEKIIRKALGTLLILIPISITIIKAPAGILFGIILIPLLVIFVPYLILAKSHHIILDIFLFLLGLVIYKVGGGFLLDAPWSTLKELVVSSTFSDPMSWIGLLILIFKTLIFIGATFILASDISALSKSLVNSTRRKTLTWIVFLILSVIIVVWPFIRNVELQSGPASAVSYGGSGQQNFSASPKSSDKEATGILEVDKKNRKWVYKLRLQNISNHEAEIVAILYKNKQLVPPFNDTVVEQGEKIGDKIIVEKGQAAVFRYYSTKPLWIITVKESSGAEYQFSFLR